jgi:hypothetical protein
MKGSDRVWMWPVTFSRFYCAIGTKKNMLIFVKTVIKNISKVPE